MQLQSPQLKTGYIPSWSMPKTWNLWRKFDWWIKSLILSSHQDVDSSKIPKYATTLDSSRLSKSTLSATKSLIPSTKVAIKKFPLSRNIGGNDYPFRSLRLTSEVPKMSLNFFQNGVFSISSPGFPITTNLMSAFKRFFYILPLLKS